MQKPPKKLANGTKLLRREKLWCNCRVQKKAWSNGCNTYTTKRKLPQPSQKFRTLSDNNVGPQLLLLLNLLKNVSPHGMNSHPCYREHKQPGVPGKRVAGVGEE